MTKRIVPVAVVALWLVTACSQRRDWELAFNKKPPPGQDARFSTRGEVDTDAGTDVPAGWGGRGTLQTPRTMFENHDVIPVRGEEGYPSQAETTPQ